MTLLEEIEARGFARGEARGWAEVLLEQLHMKFTSVPADMVSTVRAADVDQLRTWTSRMFTADTLEDIFR